ncbi:PPOX class F420-dependent oxidoreductase [Micromonospora sagamiensis]|uniref:PPOX class probable F420-dependent enzyme n=1 Tax=Micromonospora sagamiensis TaxID=47875 RepID=A0A562WBB7_9ACTN|nr:PPOX class F420-dependent oxidoreductase [Micromonospora sagamiensis]TWJ27569.1 PPOX class probable F420-dependent enzyme [Micromonospora sagamiensis]BCL13546.1 PPOX class F420-dependent enzyme [Micromonospora sagamiensis]
MTDAEREDKLIDTIATHSLGVLATIRRDGSPQQSTVVYSFDREERLIRVSVTGTRAKTANLRRDPRASFHVSSGDGWTYTAAQVRGELTPVATDPHDEVVEELVGLYRAVRGEHPDWDDYRRAMVQQGRMVLRLRVERVVGIPAGD